MRLMTVLRFCGGVAINVDVVGISTRQFQFQEGVNCFSKKVKWMFLQPVLLCQDPHALWQSCWAVCPDLSLQMMMWSIGYIGYQTLECEPCAIVEESAVV